MSYFLWRRREVLVNRMLIYDQVNNLTVSIHLLLIMFPLLILSNADIFVGAKDLSKQM